MQNKPIYWTYADDYGALVRALDHQSERMTASGFHIAVTSSESGRSYSSPEFGSFHLSDQKTQGILDARSTAPLGALLLLGVHGSHPTSLRVANSDGLRLTHAQRQQAIKDRVKSASPYDLNVLLILSSLMTNSAFSVPFPDSGNDFDPPFVRF